MPTTTDRVTHAVQVRFTFAEPLGGFSVRGTADVLRGVHALLLLVCLNLDAARHPLASRRPPPVVLPDRPPQVPPPSARVIPSPSSSGAMGMRVMTLSEWVQAVDGEVEVHTRVRRLRYDSPLELVMQVLPAMGIAGGVPAVVAGLLLAARQVEELRVQHSRANRTIAAERLDALVQADLIAGWTTYKDALIARAEGQRPDSSVPDASQAAQALDEMIRLAAQMQSRLRKTEETSS